MRRALAPILVVVLLGFLGPFSWSAGTLKVTTPNGSESWTTGKKYTIKWNKGNAGAYVKIQLLKSGKAYKIIKAKTKNDGKHPWKISSAVKTGSAYKIRISSISKATVKDQSDKNFTITKASTTPQTDNKTKDAEEEDAEEIVVDDTIQTTTSYCSLTCWGLHGGKVYASNNRYLGRIANEYSSQSIFNEYGSYGSIYSSTSIWNAYGSYGSQYSSYSPWNRYTSTPPIIVNNGAVCGYLTINPYKYPGISPTTIGSQCYGIYRANPN